MGSSAVLLTCDVKGLGKSCALHKLRWKSVLSSTPEREEEEEEEHPPEEEEEEEEAATVTIPSKLSPEPSAEQQKILLAREDTGLFTSGQPSPRLKRTKSDESIETARSKLGDDATEPPLSIGVEDYSEMVASGPPLAGSSAQRSPVFFDAAAAAPSSFSQQQQQGFVFSQGFGRAAAVATGLMMRRNSSGASSQGAGEEWGFYEDCDASRESTSRQDVSQEIMGDRVTPEYVLEDSLASQALWHSTAGKRPPQPVAERKKFEALWAKNFEESEVDYAELDRRAADNYRPAWARASFSSNSSSSSSSEKKTPHVVPLLREQSPFGTSATKSWECPACGELSSMMVHIPKYQVVKEGNFDIHAEYLVVVRLRFVTFGLWRRYSDFQKLADKILRDHRPIDFENTLGSWRCVKRRQKWFRCLDKDYITLKCFLLERFLHDAVFESTSSELFLDFLEIQVPDDDDDDADDAEKKTVQSPRTPSSRAEKKNGDSKSSRGGGGGGVAGGEEKQPHPNKENNETNNNGRHSGDRRRLPNNNKNNSAGGNNARNAPDADAARRFHRRAASSSLPARSSSTGP